VGGLVVIDPIVIVVLLAGSVLGWVTYRVVRRRRRLLGRCAAALTVAFALLAAGDVVNAHFAYLPRVSDVVGVPSWPTIKAADVLPAPAGGRVRVRRRGAVLTLPLPAPRSGFARHAALVYLPPQYFTEPWRRFPVVYLLHGSPGASVDWFRADRASDVGLTAADAGTPLILVAPTVSRRWSDDSECVDSPRERIETFLTADVIPDVDRALRTLPVRRARALAGNSAGGYCALNLGLRHRDLFATIIDLSGYTSPTHDGGLRALFGHGHELAHRVAANTPAQYAAQLHTEPRVRLWLDSGRADHRPRRDLSSIAPVLRSRGQDVTLQLRPGAHNHNVWRPALRQAILWAAPKLSR